MRNPIHFSVKSLLVTSFFFFGVSALACDGEVTSEALDQYKECLGKLPGSSGADHGFIIDADTKEAWVVDKDGGNPKCYEITVGENSNQDPAKLGDVPTSNETPPGLLCTAPHSTDKFPEGTSLGLKGVSSDNSSTESRGVLIHPSDGPTQGCIGIKDGKFDEVKEALGEKAAPVYVYSKSMDGADCDGHGKGIGGSSGGSASKRGSTR